ncbi:MAG: HNH endonuclease [Pseudomonadales bacterium]|nr:HNH endonuclease [Pseudomonadales bacterium]
MSHDEKGIPKDILELCKKVTAKRARTVIDHLLVHEYITTEELKNTYGYDHPPRAIRDVREQGIPLETFKVISTTTGRKIGAYRFDKNNKVKNGRIGGRSAFPKSFKDALIERYDSRITTTNEKIEPRYLQIDHRIPYEVAGNEAELSNLDEFMLLDASAQRAKSWSCESCENFKHLHSTDTCRRCFWAFPEKYDHVAMKEERTLSITWSQDEINAYNQLCNKANNLKTTPQALIKQLFKDES